MGSLRLVNGDNYRGKCSDLETVVSSFGLLTLHQQPEKSGLQKDVLLDRLQEFLIIIELSVVFGDKEVCEAGERPQAAHHLAMPTSSVPRNVFDDEIAGTVEALKPLTSNSKGFHDLSKTRSPNC